MQRKFYRIVFLVGALWNLLGGLYIAAAANQIFARAGLAHPSPPLYFHSWIALFMVFGIGYYLAFRDMQRHRDVVLLGIIGKLAFSSICFYNLAVHRDQVPIVFLIPAAGDLAFAALFSLFLARSRRHERGSHEARV